MNEGNSERPPIEEIAAYARGEITDSELRIRIEADEEAMELVRQIQTDDEFLTQLAGAWSNAPDGSGRGVPPAADLVPGYRILGELHRGGQGTVYRAIQERTKRTVAVKLMHGGAAASSKSRARFEREVELVASMRHPNIVTVYDGGDLPDGGYFVAMEFIRGVPLLFSAYKGTVEPHVIKEYGESQSPKGGGDDGLPKGQRWCGVELKNGEVIEKHTQHRE